MNLPGYLHSKNWRLHLISDIVYFITNQIELKNLSQIAVIFIENTSGRKQLQINGPQLREKRLVASDPQLRGKPVHTRFLL